MIMVKLNFSILLSLTFIHSSHAMFAVRRATVTALTTSRSYSHYHTRSYSHYHSGNNDVRIAIAHLEGLVAKRPHRDPKIQRATKELLAAMVNITPQVTTEIRRKTEASAHLPISDTRLTGC
jgi:hypothetical protein